MARRRKPGAGVSIAAKINVDLSQFEAALAKLDEKVRGKLIEKALLAGGDVIRGLAVSRAPGPGVVVETMKGSKLGKGLASGAMKKGIKSTGIYVAIGPDREHWYYRFAELGVKAHGVKKRKKTRYHKYVGKKSAMLQRYRNMRPTMAFEINGRMVFVKKVRGFAARPFLGPAIEQGRAAALGAVGKVLMRELDL